MNRHKRILICPKCEKLYHDENMLYNHIENDIKFECNCLTCHEEILMLGLIVIGCEAVDECEMMLDDSIT